MHPKSTPVDLSVIIPAYNEQERIAPTLSSVHSFLKTQPYTSEIVVVDDGSSDATAHAVRESLQGATNWRLLQHDRNAGKGWAVRTGMLRAFGRYRLFMDADNSTTIEHWRNMASAWDDATDIMVGSRHVEGANIEVHQGAHRELLGAAFRSLVTRLFDLQVRDTQNGFKAFTAHAAQEIFKRQTIRGWAFDVEILSLAQKLRYRVREIPIKWRNDDRSRVSMFSTPLMLFDLMRLRFGGLEEPISVNVRTTQWVYT